MRLFLLSRWSLPSVVAPAFPVAASLGNNGSNKSPNSTNSNKGSNDNNNSNNSNNGKNNNNNSNSNIILFPTSFYDSPN